MRESMMNNEFVYLKIGFLM